MSRFFAALGGEGGLASPEEERAERLRIQATLHELAQVEPSGAVTEEALAALKERYTRRLAYLSVAPGARKRVPAPDVTPVPALPAPALPAPALPAADSARPAGPGLREFLAERSILIVSYVGAFLLIVATLLFELAAETFGGPVRFAGVLVLDLVFGAAAWVCWRSPRLRIVGTTYLAIFALIAPLVFVAAYVFLVLREQGVGVSLAVAVGALSCAALYGLLAARLRSTGYAALSCAALIAGWTGALIAAGVKDWHGAGLTPLPVLFAVIAAGIPLGRVAAPGRIPVSGTFPARVAGVFVHLAAGAALLWTLGGVSEQLFMSSQTVSTRWAMTATFAGLAIDYAVYGWLTSRWGVTPLVALFASLAALASCAAIETDWAAASLVLLALAWVYAALSVCLPAPAPVPTGARQALRAIAAFQAAACALVPATPDWLQAAIAVLAAGLGVYLAWSGSRSSAVGEGAGARRWLLYAGAVWSVAWFWLVKATVPPPPRPTFLGLLTAYSPLPVLLAIVGVAVSRLVSRAWALPVYGVAAANAAWVGIALAVQRESAVTGWTYLAFALTVYVVVALERYPGGAALGATLVMAGIASLLRAFDQPPEWWPPLLAVIPWATYALGALWQRRAGPPALPPQPAARHGTHMDASTEHRWTALALAGVVALGCFGVPSFYQRESLGALASLAALGSFAALVSMESLRRGVLHLRAAAIALVAVGSVWVGRYLGLENAQWYVVPPGLALLWDGMLLRRGSRDVSRALSTAGLALLLGTTALQAAGSGADDGVYTAVLVAESIAALLAGVALRQRVYVLVGAAGAALAALRALLMLLSQVPLFAVFGVAALLLLGLAALLAVLRERLGRGGGSVASTWADWD